MLIVHAGDRSTMCPQVNSRYFAHVLGMNLAVLWIHCRKYWRASLMKLCVMSPDTLHYTQMA
jgi:hypothetical protein